MNKNSDSWIATYSGKEFDVYSPDLNDICIEDIAHALAYTGRYGGHTNYFYSVAQHCVLMTNHIQQQSWYDKVGHKWLAQWALLHDAAEAYVGDLPRPIKRAFPDNAFKNMENVVMSAIQEKFRLSGEEPALIKELDHNIVADEAMQLFQKMPSWVTWFTKVGIIIDEAWSPDKAEMRFLAKYRELFE